MVAAGLANMAHGGDRVSEQAANLPVVTQADAGQMLQVSERSVHTAAKIERESPTPIAEAVRAGVMSLNLAS